MIEEGAPRVVGERGDEVPRHHLVQPPSIPVQLLLGEWKTRVKCMCGFGVGLGGIDLGARVDRDKEKKKHTHTDTHTPQTHPLTSGGRARTGVMGGWSPTSTPPRGRATPSASRPLLCYVYVYMCVCMCDFT